MPDDVLTPDSILRSITHSHWIYTVSRYEMNNLLVSSPSNHRVIAKAEYLKVLLLEWMQRHDGNAGYFSSAKYNNYEGKSDTDEIARRRTWDQVPYWQSEEDNLSFHFPVKQPSSNGNVYYQLNKYLYIGRTSPGVLNVKNITVTGEDRQYFRILSPTKGAIGQGEHMKIPVAFRSTQQLDMDQLEAYLVIQTNVKDHELHVVRLGGADTDTT